MQLLPLRNVRRILGLIRRCPLGMKGLAGYQTEPADDAHRANVSKRGSLVA